MRSALRSRSPAPAGLPPEGAEYPQVLRGTARWRSLLGVVLAVASLLVVPAVVSRAVVALGWATAGAGQDHADVVRRADAFELPLGLLAANLAIAALALVSRLLMASIHGLRPRWLSSVRPGLRWSYLSAGVAVAAVVLVGGQLAAVLVTSPGVQWAPQPGFAAFLVVIVLTSPLQALGEELLFRGYLLQATGSLVSRAWFGVVVSAVVFALLHGAQNPAMFADRLALGLLAGLLVWRTGGVEAAAAAHAVSNVAAYTIAGLTTSVATARAVEGIGWVDAAFDVAGFTVFVLVAVLVARRRGLRTRVERP